MAFSLLFFYVYFCLRVHFHELLPLIYTQDSTIQLCGLKQDAAQYFFHFENAFINFTNENTFINFVSTSFSLVIIKSC